MVTGAAGFIGSNVSEHLEETGFQVIRSDLVLPVKAVGTWRRADLMRADDLVHLTEDADAICHIGGIGDVYAAEKDPQSALTINGTGTLNLLEATVFNRVPRFVYASTWEVYGTPHYEPVDERHPCVPNHPYSISKLVGDLVTQSYGTYDSTHPLVLRLGTAYGRGMRPTAVIPAFIRGACQRARIEIHGTGQQFRQFTHVSDIADAFRLALTTERREGVFNIVSPEKTTIRALAESVVDRFPADIVHLKPRPREVASQLVSSELAARYLGWTPHVEFQRGLAEFVTEFVSTDST